MQCKGCSRSVTKCLPKNPRPVGFYFVLSISKVNKTEWLRFYACSFEVIIFCPIFTVTNSVSIDSIWLKISKSNIMIMRIVNITPKKCCDSFKFICLHRSTTRICNTNLGIASHHRSISSPRD